MSNFNITLKMSMMTLIVSEILCPTAVFAAGYQINEISPMLQGNAMAGAAAANNDVSSMYINPATLTTLKENQIYAGGSVILPSIEMKNASAIHRVNVPGQPPSNITAPVRGDTKQDSISKTAYVPASYIGWRICPDIVVGVAVVGPFGLTTTYNDNSVVRFVAQYSAIRSVTFNPAIAYSINPEWSVGAGLQGQYFSADLSNFNGPYTGIDPIDDLIAADNPTYLRAKGWGFGYNVGVLFQPDKCTRVGLGYRSEIHEHLSGQGQQYTSPGDVVLAPSHNFLFNAQTEVKAAIQTPAVLTLSGARDIQNWTVKASVQLNFWDTFDQLTIDMPGAFATNTTIQTQWKNSWFGAIGADYHFDCAWTLRAGVAYDETPTQDAYRDPRLPDADRVWASIGATYAINKCLSIDAAYTYLFIKDQTVNVREASGQSATSTVPLEVNEVHADFTGNANILAVALRYSF